MTKYSQEEYIKFAIQYLKERGLTIYKAEEIAIMDLPSQVKWDLVKAYIARDKDQMIVILKTNLNI